jgi:hypothetical protein
MSLLVIKRPLWWKNKELLEFRWGRKLDKNGHGASVNLCAHPTAATVGFWFVGWFRIQRVKLCATTQSLTTLDIVGLMYCNKYTDIMWLRGGSTVGNRLKTASIVDYMFIIFNAMNASVGHCNPIIFNTFSVPRATSMHHTTSILSLIIKPLKVV